MSKMSFCVGQPVVKVSISGEERKHSFDRRDDGDLIDRFLKAFWPKSVQAGGPGLYVGYHTAAEAARIEACWLIEQGAEHED